MVVGFVLIALVFVVEASHQFTDGVEVAVFDRLFESVEISTFFFHSFEEGISHRLRTLTDSVTHHRGERLQFVFTLVFRRFAHLGRDRIRCSVVGAKLHRQYEILGVKSSVTVPIALGPRGDSIRFIFPGLEHSNEIALIKNAIRVAIARKLRKVAGCIREHAP